ncbi:MAG: methyltransferase family protein [Alphaproteobacteria bacterium]
MNEPENQPNYSDSTSQNDIDSPAPASETIGTTESAVSTPARPFSLEEVFKGPYMTNVIMAALFSNALILHYYSYIQSPRLSSLLLIIQLCVIVLFFLIRTAPKQVSKEPKDWIAAIIGTALPMLLSPVSAQDEIIPLMIIQFLGMIMSIASIISLNISFAVVPAERKIKKKGLYKLVRHPIYLSYFISLTCMVLQNFSVLNVAILLIFYAAETYRLTAEERILSKNPEYQRYKERVRYRLIPFVW